MIEQNDRVPETAARHIVARVPVARDEERVGSVLGRLAGHRYDSAEAVYVTDETGRLQGLVRLTDLLAQPPERALKETMWAEPPSVRPEDDQERVAILAVAHGLAAVPVVDPEGRLLGVVPPQALIEILRREHVEDLHRLAGILREDARARIALEAPPARRVRDRLPWLLVGLAGSMLATFIVSRFEHALTARVAVAFFIPGLVYLADAIGTQTEAIVVRGLSHGHGPLGPLVAGELRTGLLIGLALGAVIFPAVWLSFGDAPLALAVALGMVVAGGVASTIGLLLPWTLSALGRDPAFGSGPLATIIQDLLSVLIYFVIVTLLVL